MEERFFMDRYADSSFLFRCVQFFSTHFGIVLRLIIYFLFDYWQWCARNFISGRALVRALNVRQQMSSICSRDFEKGGLNMDISLSCGEDDVQFLKCACAGLFLQSASRIVSNESMTGHGDSKRNSGNSGRRGCSKFLQIILFSLLLDVFQKQLELLFFLDYIFNAI